MVLTTMIAYLIYEIFQCIVYSSNLSSNKWRTKIVIESHILNSRGCSPSQLQATCSLSYSFRNQFRLLFSWMNLTLNFCANRYWIGSYHSSDLNIKWQTSFPLIILSSLLLTNSRKYTSNDIFLLKLYGCDDTRKPNTCYLINQRLMLLYFSQAVKVKLISSFSANKRDLKLQASNFPIFYLDLWNG